MSIKIITPEMGIRRNISDAYSVLNLLTAQDSDNVSFSISTALDHNETTKTTSDRVYYILEGEMIIDGSLVKKGDTVFVPANTEYKFQGSFTSILVNSPPFKKENESLSK